MTREEAIAVLAESKRQNEVMRDNPSTFWASHQMADGVKNAERRIAAFNMALSALRPVSREQIAKIWPGCDACEIPCNNCESIYAWDRYGKPQECTGCPENGYKNHTPESQFCEFCGRPLTDEAVEDLKRKWEDIR